MLYTKLHGQYRDLKRRVAMNGLNLYLYKYEPLRVNVTQRVENAAFRKTESYWHL